LSSNWCPEVYRSVFIDRQNDDRVLVAPCCNARQRAEPVDSFDFYTSSYLTELRQKFDQGLRPDECRRCWHAEDVGRQSRRQSAIEFFNIEEDTSVQLESIDYSATWACNLACVMCGPTLSSSWATELNLNSAELLALGRKFQKSNSILDQLDLSQIKKIHFNGGEPLLNNDQVELLERLDRAGRLPHVSISYNTNGTVWPTDQVLDLWSRARLVRLFFSIDAVGSAYEYVRYPGKWQHTEDNLKKLRDRLPGNVLLGINLSVGTYNVFEAADVLTWFDQHLRTNREGDPSDFCWQFVYNFDVKNLNRETKENAIEQLSGHKELAGIVDYLKSTINYKHSDEWTHELDKIDSRRGTNWRTTMRVGKYY